MSRHRQRHTDRSAADQEAIARLRAAGFDTSQPRDIAHSLRLPDHVSDTLVAELVNGPGRAVVVGPHGQGSGCPVIVFVEHALTPEGIAMLRAEMEAVAERMGGRYEGWSLPGSVTWPLGKKRR